MAGYTGPLLEALIKKLEGDIAVAVANVEVYKTNASGIGEHSDLVETIEKEVELKFDLERNVNLVNFENGKIDISFNENLKKNFVKNLSDKLYKWTSKRWIISLSQTKGQKTIKEKSDEIKKNEIKKFNDSEITKRILSTFPDATLTEIKDIKKDE